MITRRWNWNDDGCVRAESRKEVVDQAKAKEPHQWNNLESAEATPKPWATKIIRALSPKIGAPHTSLSALNALFG